MKKLHYAGPVVLVVMDGVGLSLKRSGNALRQAHTEFLDYAMANYLNIPLEASGEAVGIMPGQMGNSEVGHNAIGSGQIIQQGIAQVEAAFKTGAVWDSKAWRGAMSFLKSKGPSKPTRASKIDNSAKAAAVRFWQEQASKNSTKPSTLHFCGIFSDGGVHSDIKYLEQMIAQAYQEGVRRIRIHALFDGRDVAPQSEPKYIDRLEKFATKFRDADIRIASGGGREIITADRYENSWPKVKAGYDLMVKGGNTPKFKTAHEAILSLRRQDPRVQDQYLPAFVVVDDKGDPIGKIKDGDALIYFDFRADRAIEIARAFAEPDFDKFNRGILPKIFFAGLTEYDKDRHLPQNMLVPPIVIHDPLNTFLGQQHVSQLAISETLKFGHITYYFNGNSYKKAPGEKHIEILSESSAETLNHHPWLKSAEITNAAIENMAKFDFVRINFPNGDMIGHFAELESSIIAVEAVDLCLKRLATKVDELGGMMIITADHGNVEELIDSHGDPKTSHTTNPVPCIFYDNTANRQLYRSRGLKNPGLPNLAATITTLLGLKDYPATWQPPLILKKKI